MIFRFVFLTLPISSALCGGVLTFDTAVSRAMEQSPQLKISEANVDRSEGDKIQAATFPNPIAAYFVENVFGTHHWEGVRSAESNYEIAQLVELGSKRCNRKSLAQSQYYAAQAGYEATKLELLNRLTKAFVETAAAQQDLALAESQLKIAQDVLGSVSDKVEAGKVSIIQKSKAEIALADNEIHLEMAVVDLKNANERLALLWGSNCADFDTVIYPFFEIETPKELDEYLCELENNPQLIQSQYEYLAAHQNLKLEKSNAVPDVVFTVGYKTRNHEKNKGMILGASIPIPIFDQNQGSIYKAKADIARSEQEYLETQLYLENKLSQSHKELVRAYEEVSRLKTRVVDSAENAFELAKEGYLQGKFEYLEMLDAQKTLYDVKDRYIQALLNYHEKRADVEYLTTSSGEN
jgi:outer membrane protein, heavy metal efflux system